MSNLISLNSSMKVLKWSQFSTSVLHFSGAISGVWGAVSVYSHFSRITALRILPKLGMKLEGDELGTVTEPVFP